MRLHEGFDSIELALLFFQLNFQILNLQLWKDLTSFANAIMLNFFLAFQWILVENAQMQMNNFLSCKFDPILQGT